MWTAISSTGEGFSLTRHIWWGTALCCWSVLVGVCDWLMTDWWLRGAAGRSSLPLRLLQWPLFSPAQTAPQKHPWGEEGTNTAVSQGIHIHYSGFQCIWYTQHQVRQTSPTISECTTLFVLMSFICIKPPPPAFLELVECLISPLHFFLTKEEIWRN